MRVSSSVYGAPGPPSVGAVAARMSSVAACSKGVDSLVELADVGAIVLELLGAEVAVVLADAAPLVSSGVVPQAATVKAVEARIAT